MRVFLFVAAITILSASFIGCGTQYYEKGYEAGYQDGYDEGRDEGYQEGSEDTKSPSPQIELPDINIPDIKLPDIELPDIELPDINIDINPDIDFSPQPAPEIPSDEQYVIHESPITMKIIVLGKEGESHKYRTVLEENSGADFNLTSLTREFIEVGYSWAGDKDYILDRLGTNTVPANGKLEWETEFDLSEARDYYNERGEVTYRESWFGIDHNGNALGVTSSISTNEF
ncbi:hypothetical protein ACFLYV_02105 [Chloroflexota bacterium]